MYSRYVFQRMALNRVYEDLQNSSSIKKTECTVPSRKIEERSKIVEIVTLEL